MSYNILFVDGPLNDGLTILNYESLLLGLERSTVDASAYKITRIRTNYIVQETKDAVLKYIDSVPNIDAIVKEKKFYIFVLASNQLFGALEALKEKKYIDNVLVISSSGLGTLPPGENLSLLYSGFREIEALNIHQKIQKVEYAIMLYDESNVYNSDYKTIFQENNLLKETIYIPFNALTVDNAITELNRLLSNMDSSKLKKTEVILDCFTKYVNYIVPKIDYYNGFRVFTNVSGDDAEPINANIKMPVMQTKVIPLDVTVNSSAFFTYMLKYKKVPSGFAAGYFDAGVQTGQMMKENMPINVVGFCNRITLYYFGESVQYAGAWLNVTAKRNLNSNYAYIYTYDPIMDNKNKVMRYHQRSPWMPVLPKSAAMPYYIINAFWVEPKQWLVYYSPWRLFSQINIPERFLKLYLGMDKSNYIKSKTGGEFTITGYASEILPVYFTRKSPSDTKENINVSIPPEKEFIFQYPFNAIVHLRE